MTWTKRVLAVTVAAGGIALIAGCGGGYGGGVRTSHYGGYYGPGPYWGYGGGVIIDAPIIVGPPDDIPIAVPLPEYDYDW